MKHRKVEKVMTSDVVSVGPEASFKQVARLLAEHRISGLPVVNAQSEVLGVIAETDLMTRQAAPAEEPGPGVRRWAGRRPRRARRPDGTARARTAGHVMSAPAVTVHRRATVAEAARIMARHRIERLPVVDDQGHLCGIVTPHDLVGVFLRTDRDIRREVIDEVLVRALWLTPTTIEVTVNEGVVTLKGRLERRSEIPVAVRLAGQADGVVAVVDELTYRIDDSHLRPDEQALHGVADNWLRKR